MSSLTMIPANYTSTITANGSVIRHKLGVDMTITAGGEVNSFELEHYKSNDHIWIGNASKVYIRWSKYNKATVARQYELLLNLLSTFATISHYPSRVDAYGSYYSVEITFTNSDQAAIAVKGLAQYSHLFITLQAFEARIRVDPATIDTISQRFSELCALAPRDKLSIELQRDTKNITILSVTGYNRLAVINAKRQLQELIQKSATLDTTTIQAPKVETTLTCQACFDTLERPVRPSCGHQSIYCAECLVETYRATNKKGPLCCTAQDENGEICKRPLDLECLYKNLPPALFESFLDLAADAFAASHPRFIRHCPTPGCTQVYQPTLKTTGCMGMPKTCPDCLVRICTTCAEEHDDSSSCESLVDENLHQAKKDMHARDCPECATPIIRYEGCNKVECTGCGICICWKCMETFPTPKQAYQHMLKEHGTVGEGYMLIDENGNPVLNEREQLENQLANDFYWEEQGEAPEDDGQDRGEGRMELRPNRQQQQRVRAVAGRLAAPIVNDEAEQAGFFW